MSMALSGLSDECESTHPTCRAYRVSAKADTGSVGPSPYTKVLENFTENRPVSKKRTPDRARDFSRQGPTGTDRVHYPTGLGRDPTDMVCLLHTYLDPTGTRGGEQGLVLCRDLCVYILY